MQWYLILSASNLIENPPVEIAEAPSILALVPFLRGLQIISAPVYR
jgi:hypothetical protein